MIAKTVIFIASELRSGSTLLDRLIGNHEEVVTVGELANLHYYLTLSPMGPGTTRNWACRCGVRICDCPFWQQVGEAFSDITGKKLEDQRTAVPIRSQAIPLLLASRLGRVVPSGMRKTFSSSAPASRSAREAAATCFQVLDAVSQVTQRNVFVDSSKRADQLLALKQNAPQDYVIKVIHVVRDGRAVAHSVCTRAAESNKQVSFLRATMTWVKTNITIHQLKSCFDEHEFVRVKYEDLCTDTEGTMTGLCNQLQIPSAPAMFRVGYSDNHNVGGSPRSFDGNTEIQLDERWKSQLTTAQRIGFWLIGRATNKALGY